MSTPYTLMRCRMKDLISCFKACKVPIDESDNQNPKASSIDHQQLKSDKGVPEQGTPAEKGGGGGGGEESPASCQACESKEDEYIVFYFRGDVIEERGLENSTMKHETGKIQVESKNEWKDTLGESSDSTTSSFAFPTIQSEWTGSPVLMPRPQGHNNARRVCIQCCILASSCLPL